MPLWDLGGKGEGLLGFGGINKFGNTDRSKAAEKKYGDIDAESMGVPGFNRQYQNYGEQADKYSGQQSDYRAYQGHGKQGLGGILAQEARGNGVGQQLVGMQARQNADRASAQQYGAMAGARPGMQAMASRNAMLGSAMAQSAVGEQAALGSAQMTLGAQNLYSQHLAGARGQDIQQTQVNNQSELDAYKQRLQLTGMQQSGAMTAEQLRTQRYLGMLGVPTTGEKTMGAIAGLGGAYFGAGGGKPAT